LGVYGTIYRDKKVVSVFVRFRAPLRSTFDEDTHNFIAVWNGAIPDESLFWQEPGRIGIPI
jgi:hypothetical protein